MNLEVVEINTKDIQIKTVSNNLISADAYKYALKADEEMLKVFKNSYLAKDIQDKLNVLPAVFLSELIEEKEVIQLARYLTSYINSIGFIEPVFLAKYSYTNIIVFSSKNSAQYCSKLLVSKANTLGGSNAEIGVCR